MFSWGNHLESLDGQIVLVEEAGAADVGVRHDHGGHAQAAGKGLEALGGEAVIWLPEEESAVELLGEVGEGVVVRPPFYCDYGSHISIGARTFVNYDCVLLDVAPIRIGAACQLATRVQLLTATHPVDPEPRRLGWESAAPIELGDNVWLGGGAVVCPGVSIGEDTVVGAGAVVTRDLPAGVVATGVPARVVREIGERNRVPIPEL